MIQVKFQQRQNDILNSSDFIYKLAHCLHLEIGINIGVFISKCQCHGTIKVLKSLNLYKTTGRGVNKSIFIDEKINLIINSTVACNEVIAKTIIEMYNGKYIGLKVNFDNDFTEYDKLKEFLVINSISGYSTYILFNPLNNLYKIGRSKNVMNRLEQIQNEFTKEIQLIAYLDKDIESILHFELREYNSFGEWFNVNSKIIDKIIIDNGFLTAIQLYS